MYYLAHILGPQAAPVDYRAASFQAAENSKSAGLCDCVDSLILKNADLGLNMLSMFLSNVI